MELIDWRALYAANRAAIEGRTVPANPDVIGRTPAVDRRRMFAMNQFTELSSLL